MSPEKAIELVAARCAALGGLPAKVTLTNRDDDATRAVAEWFRERGVLVDYGPAPVCHDAAANARHALGASIEIALSVGGASSGSSKADIGWAVLSSNASGEDRA